MNFLYNLSVFKYYDIKFNNNKYKTNCWNLYRYFNNLATAVRNGYENFFMMILFITAYKALVSQSIFYQYFDDNFL